MEYGNCRREFTSGQVARMRNMWFAYRQCTAFTEKYNVEWEGKDMDSCSDPSRIAREASTRCAGMRQLFTVLHAWPSKVTPCACGVLSAEKDAVSYKAKPYTYTGLVTTSYADLSSQRCTGSMKVTCCFKRTYDDAGVIGADDTYLAYAPAGAACKAVADCASGVCSAGKCKAATCSDGIMNGEESDTDCGGTCAGCSAGRACAEGNDCKSGVCDLLVHLCE